MGSLLPGGWSELMARNRDLALTAKQLLCEALGALPLCPPQMIGSMAVVPLPGRATNVAQKQLIPPLQNALFELFGIEVPVITRTDAPKQLIRISAQLYNKQEQYEYLAQALMELLAG